MRAAFNQTFQRREHMQPDRTDIYTRVTATIDA